MSSIMEMIMSQLSGNELDSLAEKIGADRQQTEKALSTAVPTMIEALGRRSDSGSSVENLLQNLGGSGSTGSLLEKLDIGSILGQKSGNANAGSLGLNGMGDLIGNILGNKKDKVEGSIGKSSGLSASQISMLLTIVAPLILSALSKKAQSKDAGGLDNVLQKERAEISQSPTGSILGRLFDQDGDGDFDLSDVIKLGSKFFSKG